MAERYERVLEWWRPPFLASFRAGRRFLVAPGLEERFGTSVTRLAAGKRYDEILCLPHDAVVFSGRGGVVDFYGGGHRALFPGERMTLQAFTYQLSDDLPLWAELGVGGRQTRRSGLSVKARPRAEE